jgi:hypothetical protein
MMPKEQKSQSVRITDQFHNRVGMVYELRCEGVVVSISMVGTKEQTEWEAEATAKVQPDPLVATGVGRSKSEAFAVLREAWCSPREGGSFPRLDWDGIRQALAAVRAI